VTQLRIPGPTPIPDEVRQAMGRQMINHRGVEFKELILDITAKMKTVYQTQNDLFVLTGSGTGGLEAAVVNMLSPGEKVLSVSIGVFGDRFASIAKTFGAEVIPLKFEFGQGADPDAVAEALAANPDVTAVLVTHNETSTGVTNDLAALARVIKGAGKLILVDAISSMSSINLPVDEWDLDVVISGSQKGWMIPPGLVFASVSPTAWEAAAKSKMPSFYWDFGKAKSYLEKGQTPWTPGVAECYGLSVSLDMLLAEGLDNLFARHARIAEKARQGVKALGLPLFADPKYASDTITSVAGPEGMDVKKLLKVMREEHDVVLAGGQQTMDGKIFRIGHLGFVCDDDIDVVLKELKLALPKVGFGGA
jgi:aspartate aminotransferase-like enzyme